MGDQTKSTLAAAFVKAQAEIHNPPLDGKNPHFNSKFATNAACLKVVREVCAKNGLAFWQEPVERELQVGIRTYLIHESGETKVFEPLFIKTAKVDAHGQGSAISYARRYALCSIWGIVGDDDDDGNAAVDGAPLVDEKQVANLVALAEEVGADIPKFCGYMGVKKIPEILQSDYKKAVAALRAKGAK